MQATKETVQKRPHTALWIILCVVLLCAAGAALYFCRWAEKPLTLAEGYVAAEGLTADITDGEGAVLSQPVRGTKVTYVVEDEDKDHPGLVRLVLGEDSFGYLAREQLVTDPKDVVATKIIYVRTAVNLLDEAGAMPGRLVQKGEALTVTGWQDMDASGAVGRWQVEGGYIRAEYVTMDEPSAKAQYDQTAYQLHAERGDSWGGGDAAGLDYFPREKASFEGRSMPGEVKALYLNNESIAQAAEYVEVADSCGINAFVVDIMDGGAIAYPSEVMKQYSPLRLRECLQHAGGISDGHQDPEECRVLRHRAHHGLQRPPSGGGSPGVRHRRSGGRAFADRRDVLAQCVQPVCVAVQGGTGAGGGPTHGL